MSHSNCKKYYQAGQIFCSRCEMAWDLDDESPNCLTDQQIGNMHLKRMKSKLSQIVELREDTKESVNERYYLRSN